MWQGYGLENGPVRAHILSLVVNALKLVALAGVVAVLTYRIVAPWRYVYLAVVVGVYAASFASSPTFTDFGHFLSVLIGLACYPLVRGHGQAWDPKETLAALRG